MALSEDATITCKGQVTIPKRVRDALDLEPGEEVEFVVSESGELRLRRKRDPMDRLREVRERLAPLRSTWPNSADSRRPSGTR